MKPLKDHVLLYDGDCPMCRMYSHAFVKTKMLASKGIMSYAEMSKELGAEIDIDRARNEIALIDVQNHRVTYGIESWFRIFESSFPFMRHVFRFPPVYWIFKSLYLLISYNRKVIAPSREFTKAGACDPDYNITWRWIYILITSVFISFVLNRFFNSFPSYQDQHFTIFTEWMIAMGQLVFQGTWLVIASKKRILHYFGHLMTISMIGAMLLLPVILYNKLIATAPPMALMMYFTIPIVIMLWQHIRRIRILELPAWLTYTWILYRMLLLLAFWIFFKTS